MTPMTGHSFGDNRLLYFVNAIVPFSRTSVSSATREVLQRLSPFGDDEEVYGVLFLEMLNTVTSVFSDLDPYFSRGHATMGDRLLENLLAELMRNLGEDAKLRGAGLTASLETPSVEDTIRLQMPQLHEGLLDAQTYERWQTVQDLLTFSLMLPYLPPYVQRDMEDLPRALDQAVQEALGPSLTAWDIRKLAATLLEKKRQGQGTVRPASDDLEKYAPLVLTPQRLFKSTLEHLYRFPPFLIKIGPEEYATIVVEQPFVWLKKKEMEFIASVKLRHPNLAGDSLEELLKEYLIHRKLVFDPTPPTGLLEVAKPHPLHFAWAKASMRRSRNSREDIFAVLRDPNQPSIEIDLVANHPDGFSILGEVKFVTRYENAKAYYYKGDHEKEAERDRLLNLSSYLNANPDRKAEFMIPQDSRVVPVFITNAVGPLFADPDGVVKACPLEVMLVEPFHRLVSANASGVPIQ